jgi:hypothetical protein
MFSSMRIPYEKSNAELGFAWLFMQLFNGAVLNKMLLSVEGY